MSHTIGLGPGGALEEPKKKEEQPGDLVKTPEELMQPITRPSPPRRRRERGREELRIIRTEQMAPTTKERLERRIVKGPSLIAISGRAIPQYGFPEPFISTKEPPRGLSITGPLDFEPYPTTPTPPMPKFVKGFQDVWLKYEQTMGKPSAYLMAKASETRLKAEEAKLLGKHGKAGLLFSEFMLERIGASVYEGITITPWFGIPLRPLALAETTASTLKLVDPKFRGEVGKAILADPAGFTADISGFFFGSYTASKIMSFAKVKYQAYKMTPYEMRRAKLEAYLKKKSRGTVPKTEQILEPPQQIYRPQTEKPLSLPRWYYHPEIASFKSGTWEIAHTPSRLRISDLGPTITKPFPSISPYVSGLLATSHALEKARKEKIREPTRLKTTTRKEQLDIGIAPIRKFKPIGRGRRRLREPTLPEYIVGPTEIEEQIQPVLPGYIEEPITRTRARTRVRTIQEPTPTPVPIQITRVIPSIPEIEEVKRGRPLPPFRYELKKGRGLGFLDLVKLGEIREYKVKLPEELMGELGLPRRKRKKRKS